MQLRDAANTLGVHYQTAYGWVRQGTLPARKTPRGYEVSEADVRDLMARREAGVEPPTEVRVRDWAAQADRLYTALMAGDEALVRQDFDRLAAGTPLVGLCDQVISPALRRVGLAWSGGEVSIAEEHRATAICMRLIAARARQPQGRPRGVAVTTTPPGEHHGLPSLMAAACLREDRWQVHDLGPDLPTIELIGFAAETGAALIVLSSATPDAARAASREAMEIRRRLPHVRVLTGRPGDTLTGLRELARAPDPAAPEANSNPLARTDPGFTRNAQPPRPSRDRQNLRFALLGRHRTGHVTEVGSAGSRQRREGMSQSAARHDPHAKPGDEDVDDPQARQPERRQGVRPRRPVGQPADDGGVSPDEPGEDEFELIGDNDLGAADLGPAAPNAHDPDADSGRIRKITS